MTSCGVFKKKTFECPPYDTVISIVDTLYLPSDSIYFEVPCDALDTLKQGDTIYLPSKDGKLIKYWRDEARKLQALLQLPPKEVIFERDVIVSVPAKPEPCVEIKPKNFKPLDYFIWISGLVAWFCLIVIVVYRRLTTSK